MSSTAGKGNLVVVSHPHRQKLTGSVRKSEIPDLIPEFGQSQETIPDQAFIRIEGSMPIRPTMTILSYFTIF